MDKTTRIGTAILLALPLSAAAIALLVIVVGMPLWAGLTALAVIDVAIIVGGYVAVKRSLRLNS
jgi:membrane protein implicated in regulation of membrane protease activity